MRCCTAVRWQMVGDLKRAARIRVRQWETANLAVRQ